MVATVSVSSQEYYAESAEEQYAPDYIPVSDVQQDDDDDSLVRVRRAPHRGGIFIRIIKYIKWCQY